MYRVTRFCRRAPVPVIARELARETDSKRILELTQELNEPMEKQEQQQPDMKVA